MDDENRKKLSQEERLEQREQKLAFSKHMYALTMAYLQKHLKHLTTEGRGDCWLLAIMADFEVTDHEPLKANPEPEAAHRRTEICTRRRGAIVQWAADKDRNGGFRFLCEMFGTSFNGDGGDDEEALKNAEKMVEKSLLAQRVPLRQRTRT